MNKKKIMLIFGTRPEAIKMVPLVHQLRKEEHFFDTKVCVSSQHRHMLDQVLKLFEIAIDIDLDLMQENQNLSVLTSLILSKMKDVFINHQPDLVLVHGDTTTALASSMAAFYASIPIGHVEAGLRTYDLIAPFPEEFNRQTISKIAKYHFAPTQLSKNNLLSEGIDKSSIIVTGNSVIDALFWVLKRIEKDDVRKKNIENTLNTQLLFRWKKENFILITAHRRENFGNGFIQICSAIKKLALKYPRLNFVYPVHLNPNVTKPVYEILSGIDNVHLIKPLQYEPFIYLLKYSYFVLTDSGGLQEEAPSLGKPVLVLRSTTERPEAVEAGTVKMVGSNHLKIIDVVSRLIDDKELYNKMAYSHNPYGNGLASSMIVDFLKKI